MRHLILRPAVVNHIALLIHQIGLAAVGDRHTGFHHCDRLAVRIKNGPAGRVQILLLSLQHLLQRNVAAAAELVEEGGRLALCKRKVAIGVNGLALSLCSQAGGIDRTHSICQLARHRGAVIRDILLLDTESGDKAFLTGCNCLLAVVRGQIPEVEGKLQIVGEQAVKEIVDIFGIKLLLHGQLIFIREVEVDLHVGLPHTTLHVEHGQRVLVGIRAGDLKGRGHAAGAGCPFRADAAGCRAAVRRVTLARLDRADRGSLGRTRSAEVNSAAHGTVGTADVQCKLSVNKDPDVIVTSKIKLDGDRVPILIHNSAVLGQVERKLQLGAEAVVIGRTGNACAALIEREETVLGGNGINLKVASAVHVLSPGLIPNVL